MRKAGLTSALMAVLLLDLGAANAGTITAANLAGLGTNSKVTGTGFSPNTTVQVSFRDPDGGMTGHSYEVDSAGNFSGGLPEGAKKGDKVFYTGTEANGTQDKGKLAVGIIVASVNQIPTDGTVVGVYIADAGSTLDIGSQAFALAGSFTTIDTAYDDDPTSPNYGDLSLSIVAPDFNVYSNTGPLTLSLTADDPFTLNLLPFLNDLDSGTFTSTTLPVSFPVNFVLTYAGAPYSASGTISGSMTTMLGDQADPDTFDLSLTSDLGPITGSLYTTASYTVTPEPAPVFLLLTGLALLALLGFRARIAGCPRARF